MVGSGFTVEPPNAFLIAISLLLPLDKICSQLLTLTGSLIYGNVSQPSGRGPVPGPGINYTGPREVLLEFVILVF